MPLCLGIGIVAGALRCLDDFGNLWLTSDAELLRNSMAVLFACITLISTGLGGAAAIRLRDRLHLLLGFSSGAVLAVALFDILPEVFAFDHGASYMPVTALGFLAFFGLER